MRKIFSTAFFIFTAVLLSSCAKDLGLLGGQGTATAPDFLQQDPYPENRDANLQRDMEVMWTTEQNAGRKYSTVPARTAIRRVFADINLKFKGTKEDFLNFMNGSPTETKQDRLIYRIEAPTYTDEYFVIFNSDNSFKSVEYNRIPRMKAEAGYR